MQTKPTIDFIKKTFEANKKNAQLAHRLINDIL
jgi:hypothetical protein